MNPKTPLDGLDGKDISFVPMDAVSVAGQINTEKRISAKDIKNYTVFCEGDVLFAKITPCMENGKGAIAVGLHNGYGAGSTEFIVLRPELSLISARWLLLFLSQKRFRLYCQQHMTGSAGQTRVPVKFLGACKIPVPSLEEQQRIIARIEELFSELDNGVETLQKIKQQLAVYRQAVLKEAFRDCEMWEKYSFSDLMCEIRNGYGLKPDDCGDYRILKISAVRPLCLDLSESRLNKTEFSIEDTIAENDLLFTRYNGSKEYVGVCAVVPHLTQQYAYPDKLIRCRPKLNNSIHSKYLAYYMSQGDARNYLRSKIKTTSGQNGIAGADIKKTIIYLPDIDTQTRVVAEIETKLSVCESIVKTVDTALQQAEAMRQSILKKAFEGGL
ncbi:MAG: restriction endonuclease subunit S [Clostridia bacterium]|nr:restriction endonuclease subunit S [Clostridia bacterium]